MSPFTIVICVDHAFVSGGQSKVAIESALGLKAAGARVIFFSACGPVDPRLEAAGVETVCLSQHDILGNPSRLDAARQGIWNFKASKALAETLSALSGDRAIVHVHGWAKALSPSIAKPIQASGLPAVYTMHEFFLNCPNGGFYNFQKNEVCPLHPMSLACLRTNCDSRNYPFKLWRSARQFVAEHVAHLAQTFSDILLLSDLQEKVLASCLPPGAAIHRVTNPVEAEPLGHKADQTEGDFLFVGRLSAEKGAFLFAEAARRAGVTPIFIGDGPITDELAARYPQARLLGWRPPAEARAAMRAARVLVFPSLWYETFGLTALEAKAMGTPTIVADGCAAREAVEHGVTGLWFKSGDVQSLASAIRELGNDAVVAQMSDNAYDAYWSSPATLERHVAETLAVYDRMLARETE
ncbi:glycosyltransferase family 4 protein [Methylocystis sp. MJC1]|jgi:glycosyltransferase involved in cell wall biosynthesis|uniref:glycosyltransferase family 4 protein n=1 Tax=Methylocystis sp. MJC1 TaxID=2654282 RepID=UPI0013EBA3DB|nr:glycosyltransferase family 4 protein [Methylocystis sp. MJC1]KAF2990401.1 Glycogen synthase [Methylocystis sp. MJC1]MBU6528195.1 glycosyltransferase family 4 protein [Methylocystis sp. MJC1]UZX11106.1 glycosyltransferase family 4 protein [Methylocystis sp. MJC1]